MGVEGGVWRVRQISSPYWVGGEMGYTAQEDLKSIDSYNMGERRAIRVQFFCSCISRTSLVLSALSPWVTTVVCIFFSFTALNISFHCLLACRVSAERSPVKHRGFPLCVQSVQFSSVTQYCLTLCGPIDHSMPGFPVHHQLPESTQTHVH